MLISAKVLVSFFVSLPEDNRTLEDFLAGRSVGRTEFVVRTKFCTDTGELLCVSLHEGNSNLEDFLVLACFLVSAYLRITELLRIFGQVVSGPGNVWVEQGPLQFCWLELKRFAPEVDVALWPGKSLL